MPPCVESKSGTLITTSSMKTIICLMYLLSPVQPQHLLQKLVQNAIWRMLLFTLTDGQWLPPPKPEPSEPTDDTNE
eukprot:5088960-Ditylum_brightwellii.AAC.1